jgi:hypothetical protein
MISNDQARTEEQQVDVVRGWESCLALLIVPNPGGMTRDVTGDANATPMSGIETES